MSYIEDYLDYISTANYGSDVRDAIVSSIRECYKDATGHPDSVAALVQEYVDREETVDGAVTVLTGLYNSLGDITYSYAYINHPIGLTVSNNEFACIDQITLGPGKWIIKAASYFYDPDSFPKDPARRSIYLSLYNTLDSTTNRPVCIEGREDNFSLSTSGYRGDVVTIRMMHLTEETTIYLWASCSGATGSVELAPYMTAMRVGESIPSDGTTITDQVVANTADISTLDGKVTTNISDISNIQEDLSTVNDSIDAINSNLTETNTTLSSLTLGIDPETSLAALYSNGTPIGDAIDVSGSLEPLTIDSELDLTSTHPVQNRVIAPRLYDLMAYKTFTITSGYVSIPNGGYGSTAISTGRNDITIIGATPYVDHPNHPIIMLSISSIAPPGVVIVNYYNPTNTGYNIKIGVTVRYRENSL